MPGVRHPDRLGLHLRLVLGNAAGRPATFGPGKADLLAAIAETGSIAAAGRRLGMSYKRAWSLVESLNAMFRSSLVDAAKGGAHGGGAVLTPLGARVLAAYRALEVASARAGHDPLAVIRRSLRVRPEAS
ncbi:MAG: winged helix-turn-helix domain-containing protein [Acetobacteraceae bacterium]